MFTIVILYFNSANGSQILQHTNLFKISQLKPTQLHFCCVKQRKFFSFEHNIKADNSCGHLKTNYNEGSPKQKMLGKHLTKRKRHGRACSIPFRVQTRTLNTL